MIKTSVFSLAVLCSFSITGTLCIDQPVPVYQAEPYLTSSTTKFGPLIEGTGVDKYGNFYSANYKSSTSSMAQVYREQRLLYRDIDKPNSYFNAIRFNLDPDGTQEAYLGDVINHRVVRLRNPKVDGTFANAETFCQSPSMLQPNDIAIVYSTGRLFLSGMRFTESPAVGDGDLWTCSSSGEAKRLGIFFRTNGVEVSPDEKTLYLSEAVNNGTDVETNIIHAFDIDHHNGTILNQRIFADFSKIDGSGAFDTDGIRSDIDGNLYIARWGTGKIIKLSPDGRPLAYFILPNIDKVTNLELAGPHGTDLYAVGECKDDPLKGCIDVYNGVPVQGRAFYSLQKENNHLSFEQASNYRENTCINHHPNLVFY